MNTADIFPCILFIINHNSLLLQFRHLPMSDFIKTY